MDQARHTSDAKAEEYITCEKNLVSCLHRLLICCRFLARFSDALLSNWKSVNTKVDIVRSCTSETIQMRKFDLVARSHLGFSHNASYRCFMGIVVSRVTNTVEQRMRG